MKRPFKITTLFSRVFGAGFRPVVYDYPKVNNQPTTIGSGNRGTLYHKRQWLLKCLKPVAILPFAFLWSLSVSNAQDSLLVKGKIYSGSNQPLPNVSVSIEGSNELPVLTNQSGEFTIKAATGNEWLYIDPSDEFKRKRVFINQRSEIKIILSSADIASGDDLINILSQPIQRKNIVASYAGLNLKDVNQSPVFSIDQYMQGRIPGMFVTNQSGNPGSGAVSLIRGAGSLNASNQPLYIVDGIPMISPDLFQSKLDGYTYNPLLAINPLDISSAVVVKDPTITSAYGSKASGGLVLIETLDPSATQTLIEVELRSGYSLSPSNLIPQMGAAQHKTYMNEVLYSSGKYGEIIREEYPSLFLTEEDDNYIDYQHNTNWQKLIFQNSFFNNINIKVKGGDEIARYGLSFGYIQSDGIIKSTGYDGYNLRFVSRLNIFTWLKMNAGVSMNYSTSALKESAKVKETSPILASLAKSPLLNPYQYDIEGKELTALSEVDELGTSNPLAIIKNYEATNSNYNFISTVGFEVTLKKNLILNTNFGLTYNVLKEQQFLPNHGMEHYYNQEAINVSKAANNSITSIYNNTYLRYEKRFGNSQRLFSNTGFHLNTNNFEYDWGLTKNAHESDQYRMLQDGTNSLREIGGANRKWNWFTFYENVNYSFKDRYILTAGLTADGSSRVGDKADNTLKVNSIPFGIFYSGGLAWRISGESFMKNISWIEDLKARLTYGHTGNDDIGESNATNYYKAIKFRETVGLYPALIANENLSYEMVNQLNAGLDIALWGNRARVNFDVFKSVTRNMLIYTPLDAYLGYQYRPENSGKMENRGYEINAFFRAIEGKSFKWDIQANISSVENEVLEIKGEKLVTQIEGAEIVNTVGAGANSFYGYIFDGVYSTTGEATSSGLVNNKYVAYRAGDSKYKDISGPNNSPDGVINEYDKTIIGSAIPDYFGGIVNTFTYKRWALSAFVQFVFGNDVFNYVRYKNESMTGLANQSTRTLSRWQYEGQETDVPRALWNDPVGNSAFSTRWIEDGSYLRVKNISLSYTVPDEFLAFRNAQFYISANNVLTFSRYLGYDPEVGYSQSQVEQGIDYGLVPQPRQFIVGIKLGL